MEDFKMNGAFGANTERCGGNPETIPRDKAPHKARKKSARDTLFRSLSGDDTADIIFWAAVILGTVMAVIFWEPISTTLLSRVLLPISETVGVLILVFGAVMFFFRGSGRRR